LKSVKGRKKNETFSLDRERERVCFFVCVLGINENCWVKN